MEGRAKMNVERLHALARAVRADLEVTNVVSIVRQMASQLQAQVASPQDPGPQQQVSNLRRDLAEALRAAPSNAFPPVWHEQLKELGIDDCLGESLLREVEEIFDRNQITPSTAHEEITGIADHLDQIAASLTQLLAAFEWFKVPTEELAPGEFEIEVLIPRGAVNNTLSGLGEEFEELQAILLPFVELSTGSRPPLVLRAISSSDFGAFIETVGPVAACVAVGAERVVSLYKQLLEIRRLRTDMKNQQVPDSALAAIDEHANSIMTSGIEPIIDDLVNQFREGTEDGRTNELRIELRFSLNKIANRIDAGYNIDVSAGPSEVPEDAPEQAAPTKDAQYRDEVLHRSETLKFINLTGQPILSLPEGDNGNAQQNGE
jgi:hypothetical protein